MRYPLLSVLMALAFAPELAHADSVAPITDVTLYPGSATIVRTVQVAPGASQVLIPGLPAGFDTQTLRAVAAPGIRIGEIVTKDAATSEATSPVEAGLRAKLTALQDEIAALDVEANSAEIVKGYLEHLGSAGGGNGEHPAAPVDAKNLTALIDAMGHGAHDALAKIQKVAVQRRELEKKVEAVKQDLAHVQTGLNATRTVAVNVTAERGGSVQVSYQLNNAGWRPAYRASLDSDSAKIDLERLATISQKTGEDWSNVHLTLSTSQPRMATSGPEPQPWLLAYMPPELPVPEAASYAAAPKMAMAPAPMGALIAGSSARRASEPGYVPPTFETEGTFATEFEVPNRVNLPTDGREVSVTLAKQTLAVKQHLRVVPKLDKSAYVIAEATRPQGVWPAGNVQLFRDGNYIGASQWAPGNDPHFAFSFGRDDLMQVAVHPLKANNGTAGVFGKKTEETLSDAFVLTSNHKAPIAVEVLASSPVSTSDQIKVEANYSPKPANMAWEQRQGVVAWEKTLSPNEAVTFTVDYKISYPQEGSVNGLR